MLKDRKQIANEWRSSRLTRELSE